MKVLRKLSGLEPDFYDFQVVDLVDGTHYVFFDGINPEGETVEIVEAGIKRKGKGIWFKEVSPDPYKEGEHEMVLFFMDSVFPWHEHIKAGEGERYVAVGRLSFKLVPEFGIKESTLPIISRLRKKKGTQYILLAEFMPWIPDQEHIEKWLQYVQTKGWIERLPEITAEIQRMTFELKDLRFKNNVLQEEAARLRAERDSLYREVARLRNEYAFIRLSEEAASLLEKLQVQAIEEKKKEIEKPPLLSFRREKGVKEDIEKLKKEIEEIKEKTEKAGKEEVGE
jgi:FtsZ-binding cell division protein ZapB